MRWRAGIGLVAGLLLHAGSAAGQADPHFAIRALGAAEGWRPEIQADNLLRDDALRHALDGGLPVRFHLRVELWEKQLFDRLVDSQDRYIALEQDPIDRHYELDVGRGQREYATLEQAEAALQAALRPAIRPAREAGRFYYLASLQIETLSLSDIEELRRWLRGEAAPAVQGDRSPERALESGLRRVLVRVIGLPARRYEGRSATFRMR
jgi:hypothetical protein